MDGVDDLNRLAVDLTAGAVRVGARAALVVRKTALDVEATAKAFCPVDTGNLRSSIGHDFTGDGRSGTMAAEIGPTASYGAYVEFGTSRMAPHAYMGPALDRHTPEFVEALAEAGGDMLL